MQLILRKPVGDGQDNDSEDIANLEDSLGAIGVFTPRTGPPSPLPVPTPELDMAVSRFQSENGLKVDGLLKPGGPTERAINNQLEGKPAGVALAVETSGGKANGAGGPGFKLNLKGGVGEGEANPASDVRRAKQALAAIGRLPEDPFDNPGPAVDGEMEEALKAFQRESGLRPDAIARPGGPTEQALNRAVTAELINRRPEYEAYLQRARATRGSPDVRGKQGNPTGVKLAAFNPKRPSVLDGAAKGGDDAVPVRSIPRPIPGPPFPAPYIPTREDLRRIRRDIERFRFTVPLVPSAGPPTITFGPDPDAERNKKPEPLRGPEIDRPRNVKPFIEAYPSEAPKIPPLPGIEPDNIGNIILIGPSDSDKPHFPIFLESRRGGEVTRRHLAQSINSVLEGARKRSGPDWRHESGGRDKNGNEKSEKGIRTSDGRIVFPDAVLRNKKTDQRIYIQTVDSLVDGSPSLREAIALGRLLMNTENGDLFLIIVKPIGSWSTSEADIDQIMNRAHPYLARSKQHLEEIKTKGKQVFFAKPKSERPRVRTKRRR